MSLNRLVWTVVAGLALGAGPVGAASISGSSFDQVAQINSLGGSVTQIGGVNAGGTLLTSADFFGAAGTGAATIDTGLAVSMPGYVFVNSVLNFNDAGSTEPGNTFDMLLGAPTDATFTLPGPGGPDGGVGDGSVQFLQGGGADLLFGSTLTAPVGETADLFFFTNTASGGDATIRIMLGATVVDSIVATLPDGAAGSGLGGLTIDLADGLQYDAISIDASLNGLPVEIDAVAAATAPEPSTLGLMASSLLGLFILRRLSL